MKKQLVSTKLCTGGSLTLSTGAAVGMALAASADRRGTLAMFRAEGEKVAAVKAAIDLADFGGGAKGVGVLGVTVVQIQPIGFDGSGQILGQPFITPNNHLA
jgi:hypothetical protein